MTLKRKIEEVIARGGQVAPDVSCIEWTDICLRATKKMVAEIDKIKDPGISRNAWIRQAIKEKLQELGAPQ